jgi:hypothetical protein
MFRSTAVESRGLITAILNKSCRIIKPADSCMIRLIMLAAFIISIWGIPVQCSSQTPDPEAAVRKRITAFWDAMQKRDFEAASACVSSESRPEFFALAGKSGLAYWKIKSLKFNENNTICDAVILAGRPFGFMGVKDILDWETPNEWALAADGEWYLKLPIQQNVNPMLEAFRNQQAEGAKFVALEVPPGATKTDGKTNAPLLTPRSIVSDPGNPTVLHNGETGVFRYKYSNEGTAPIRIVAAKSSCSCISMASNQPEVLPGQDGTLEATVDTFGMPLGLIQKRITVQFNDQPDPISIDLRVDNGPNFEITPAAVDFGRLQVGKAVEKTVQITNRSGRNIKILSLNKSEPQLTITVDKQQLAPGETLVVTLRCDPAAEGDISDSPRIRTDLQAEPLINIPIRGRILPMPYPETKF